MIKVYNIGLQRYRDKKTRIRGKDAFPFSGFYTLENLNICSSSGSFQYLYKKRKGVLKTKKISVKHVIYLIFNIVLSSLDNLVLDTAVSWKFLKSWQFFHFYIKSVKTFIFKLFSLKSIIKESQFKVLLKILIIFLNKHLLEYFWYIFKENINIRVIFLYGRYAGMFSS